MNTFEPGDIVKHIDDRYQQHFGKRGYIVTSRKSGSIGYYLVQFEGDFVGNSKGCWPESLQLCPPTQLII